MQSDALPALSHTPLLRNELVLYKNRIDMIASASQLALVYPPLKK
jgi:hypothetical protein